MSFRRLRTYIFIYQVLLLLGRIIIITLNFKEGPAA